MRTYLLSAVIACAVSAATAYGQNNGETNKPAIPAPSIGLKDAFAGKFLIGTAGDVPRGYSAAELANIKANYNIITPENCMKPQIQPSEGRFDWATPDALVNWCQENNIKVWGHNLAWHTQTPGWFLQGINGGQITRELAMEHLSNHIHAVAGHYKGKVIGWDVVNEAINDGYNGEPDNLRNDSWYSIIGSNYLTMAFKWAHEADPDAQLYYNDYNIEQGAVKNRGKHAASMSLLKRMIKDGAPINGVGIQGHWHLDTDPADVEKAIADYESLGLKVSISELDVTATGGNSGAFTVGGGGALTEHQTTQINDAIDDAHAELTVLQNKLNAAEKDVVTAVLAKSDDAIVRSKLEALANIQIEIAMFRYTKAVSEIVATVTDNQKTSINATPGSIYYTFFGGNPPPAAGGRGGGGFGGIGGPGGGGGALTADQNTELNAAFADAQAELTSLQDKLTAAEKDVVTAVLAKSDDATVRSKLEALSNIQANIAMLRYTKGVTKIAPKVTADQKTNINTTVAQTYYALFGGNPPPAAGGRGGGFGGGRGGGATITAEALQKQAEMYAKLFEIFNRHANSISRVTFWGISDTRSWRAGQAALVYDGQLNPKPAYQAILDVAKGK